MRSLLLLLGAVVLIVLIGGLYVWMQPAVEPPQTVLRSTTTTVAELPPMPAPTTAPGTQPVIRRGTGLWVQVRDDKTGEIAWQSRVAEHTPRADGSTVMAILFPGAGCLNTAKRTGVSMISPGRYSGPAAPAFSSAHPSFTRPGGSTNISSLTRKRSISAGGSSWRATKSTAARHP